MSFMPGYEDAIMFDSIGNLAATFRMPLGRLFAGRAMSKSSVSEEHSLALEGVYRNFGDSGSLAFAIGDWSFVDLLCKG